MISQVRPKATMIADREAPALASILVLSGAVVAVTLLLDRAHWWQWAKHIPLPAPAVAGCVASVAIASAWLLYRGWHLGVRFDDHGVTVRKVFDADRYGWPEVSRFADGCYKTGDGTGIWALDVVLVDAQAVTLKATAGKNPSPKMLTVIGQIAAHYQIPAEVTGEPKPRDGTPANARLYPDPGGTTRLRH
jgi:hypothetical protein